MPRDAPWEEAVNGILLRLLNAGLIDKWIRDQKYMKTVKMHTAIHQTETEGSSVRVLTIGDLQLAFYVVIVGTFIGWLAFLAEHLWVRHSCWQSNKDL